MVLPGAIQMEMRFDIGHQIPEAFARMMAGAQVMHIAQGAFDGVRARTIGRRPAQGEPWVGGQPRFDGLGVMHGRVLDDHRESCRSLSRVAGIKTGQPVTA